MRLARYVHIDSSPRERPPAAGKVEHRPDNEAGGKRSDTPGDE